MSDENKGPVGMAHDFSLLRREAEKLQKPVSAEDVQNMDSHEVRLLIQELQIHQVELEMQNHQLQLTTQELEAATVKYQNLYHFSPFGYVTLDEHGLIEEANAKAVELLATSAKQLEARRFSQFIHADSLDAYYGFFRRVLLSDKPQTVELQVLARSGAVCYAHLEGLLLRRDNANDQCRIAFVDVTERKTAHMELSNKEALLSAIINSSLNAIQVFKAVRNKQGNLLDFEWLLLNRTAELFLDHTLAQLARHRLTQILPSLETDGHLYTMGNVVESGQPATFTAKVTKEGQQYWLNCVAVKLGDGVVLTFEDVTQQRIASEKLQESQLLVKKTAEAVPDFLYVEDLEQGRNLYHNKNFLAFLGYSPADIKGHPRELLDTLYHPEDAAPLLDRKSRFADVQDGVFLESNVRIMAKDGAWRHIHFRETVFKRGSSGTPIQLVGVAQDVTEKLKAEEELRQKDRTITTILENIPVIIWRLDKQGRILESVGSGLKRLGYQDHELEGRLITDLNPAIQPNINTVLGGEKCIFVGEAEVNGTKIFKQNYFLHDPTTGGGIGFCLDVTEQKAAEASARHQTMLLDQILQNLPLVLASIDPEGNFLEIKGKGLRGIGLEDNEFQGKSIFEFFPFLRKNINEILSGEIKRFTIPTTYQGKQVFYESFGFLDKQKQLGIAFGMDVSALKEVQEKLTREKEFSENLLETHLHGIIAFDNTLTFTAWNKAMEQITLQSRHTVLGKPAQALFPARSNPKLISSLQKVLGGKQVTLTKLPFLPNNRSFEITLTPLYVSDETVGGILGIVQDITTQKLQQEAITQMKLAQQKVVMDAIMVTQNEERKRIAEALHNSLAQLLYAAKLNLEEMQLDNQGQEETRPTLKKVTDFLEEAIKETRTLAHELIPRVLLDFGLKSALKDLAARLTTNTFAVRCVVTGFDQPKDYEFETHLFRFVQELLNNVMKHAQATDALVQVVDKGTAVRVRVQDNGQGMPKNWSDRTASQGIGLMTLRSRVKLLQGTMSIDSTHGEGTCITIEIPHQAPS